MSMGMKNRRQSPLTIGAVVISFLFILLAACFHWFLGVIGLVVWLIVGFLIRAQMIIDERQKKTYISTLSHRVKKVGDEALLEMPIGIILYDETHTVDWMNHYMASLIGGDPSIANSLNLISEALIPLIKGESKEDIVPIKKRRYKVVPRSEERLLYFFDVTETVDIKNRYQNEKSVFGIIYLDNYDEVTQGMDDQVKSRLNNEMTNLIKQWGIDHGIYLKRFSSEKFFAVFNHQVLKELEKTRFDVLDKVRESTNKETIPLTLSIGVGAGLTDLTELGQMAQSALDLALGRGGDQVAIKLPSGKVKFYGGKSNPVEKRTRVRARVISHALSELILESDHVLIMGHKQPDMDAIGAAIGIMKIAEANKKRADIVVETDRYGPGVVRLIDEIKQEKSLWAKFISVTDAVELATSRTLVVVVDTHKPSMVVERKLLSKTDRIVVIDHHRRGEDFIADPVLVYMEPYASSTAELVTELLEYQPKNLHLDILEATALLAGITVDTKNFALRTGSRTFDAASYLRTHGADTILVQKLLRENLEQFNRRSHLIQRTKVYREGIAIAVGGGDDIYDQVVIAQAADTLLSMEDVKASFAVSVRPDHLIGVSARSLGDVNVQLIMEDLDGGGHLTNAATQMDLPLEEAVKKLKIAIDDYFEGGDSE